MGSIECMEVNNRQASTFFSFALNTLILQHLFSGAIYYFGSRYGAATGPVHLDDIHCLGFEDSLVNCNRSYFGEVSEYCANHFSDASVFCPSECS